MSASLVNHDAKFFCGLRWANLRPHCDPKLHSVVQPCTLSYNNKLYIKDYIVGFLSIKNVERERNVERARVLEYYTVVSLIRPTTNLDLYHTISILCVHVVSQVNLL